VRALRRLNDALERSALGAVIVMMTVMCTLTFSQAAGRYALRFSLSWSEELSRFLMVWISMLGGAVAARRGMHVGFSAGVDRLPGSLRRAARAAASLLALLLFACMAWYGFKLSLFNMQQLSAALQWPMGIPYAAIPAGALLLVLFLLEEALRTVAGAERAGAIAGPGAEPSA